MATDTPSTGRDSDKFMLRFPDGMRDHLKESAKANNRTMNAEIIHMLQSHLNRIDDEAKELAENTETAQRSNIAIGLKNPVDQAAVLKVLSLEELMLLRRRVGSLGGPDAVLELDKAEIVRRTEGPALKGTVAEQESHFSQILPTYPLTALLTSEELGKLAERVVAMQATQAKRPSKKT